MQDAFQSFGTDVNRVMTRIGLMDGPNSPSLQTRASLFLRKTFRSKLSYVLYVALLLFFLLVVFIGQGSETPAYKIKIDTRDTRGTNNLSNTTTDSTIISYTNSTGNSTITNSSSLGNSTTEIETNVTLIGIDTFVDNRQRQSDDTIMWFLLVFSFMLWMIILNVLRCLKLRVHSLENNQYSRTDSTFLMQLMQLRGDQNSEQRLRMMLMNRDFSGDDYEMLQMLDNGATANRECTDFCKFQIVCTLTVNTIINRICAINTQ
jgi:hypothetical protein